MITFIEPYALEVYVVYAPEHCHWDEDVQEATKEIWGIYTFDKSEVTFACSYEATFELRQIGVEYVETDGLSEEESEELYGKICDGWDRCYTVYVSIDTVNEYLKNALSPNGQTPRLGEAGGYRHETDETNFEDVLEELRERF